MKIKETSAMTFYLNPPTGSISYQKMELYALNRLKFLIRLHACNDEREQFEVVQDAQSVLMSDCLIEGTVKDKISHYLLRLVLGSSSETVQLFLEAETALFALRLKSFNEYEWRQFFISLDTFVCDHDALKDLRLLLGTVKKQFGSVSAMVKEIVSFDTSASVITVPFQLLLNLVASRSVCLSKGMAFLPMSKFMDVLAEQFCNILSRVMRQNEATVKTLFSDKRILRLERVIKHAYLKEVHPMFGLVTKGKAISLASLQDEMWSFPPCMFKLMKCLQQHHRLQHHQRIQLTLYLKELGMPLHQALLLWKREYSKEPSLSTSGCCTHSWQGNERKYTYNIRHLYGLEGSRTQYRAHSCHSIQGRHFNSSSSDSCAFLSSDIESVSALFTQCGLTTSSVCVNHLSQLSKSKQPGRACNYFLNYKLTIFKDQYNGREKDQYNGREKDQYNDREKDQYNDIESGENLTAESGNFVSDFHRPLKGNHDVDPKLDEFSNHEPVGISVRNSCLSPPGSYLSKRKCLRSCQNQEENGRRHYFSLSLETSSEKDRHAKSKRLLSHHEQFENQTLGRSRSQAEVMVSNLHDKKLRGHKCNNINNFLPFNDSQESGKNVSSRTHQMLQNNIEFNDCDSLDILSDKRYNPGVSTVNSDERHPSLSCNVLKKRKVCEISNVSEDAASNDLGCINRPSQFYWTFRSLVDGFKQCEPPNGTWSA